MPMLDATIPEGALSAEAEHRLLERLTDVLLINEGADPTNVLARSIAWVFLHRPAKVFVAGAEATVPHYRFTVSVPEGQFDDERRAAMVREVTEAVLDAEEGRHPRDGRRVWVFPTQVEDGTWGGNGRIGRLRDIAALVMGGDPARAHAYAERRISASRRQRDAVAAN